VGKADKIDGEERRFKPTFSTKGKKGVREGMNNSREKNLHLGGVGKAKTATLKKIIRDQWGSS